MKFLAIAGVLVGTVLALGHGGCTTVREILGFGYSQPEVRLRSVEIKDVSMTTVKMLVQLRVKNPNTFALTLNKLDYKVTAFGMNLADGLFEKQFTVKAEGQGDVSIPLQINTQSALKILKTLMDQPDKDHVAEIEATVKFDSPIGEIEHTFQDEKSLSKL